MSRQSHRLTSSTSRSSHSHGITLCRQTRPTTIQPTSSTMKLFVAIAGLLTFSACALAESHSVQVGHFKGECKSGAMQVTVG